jgi:hypothetical protein
MGTFSDSISLVRAGLHLKNVFQKLQVRFPFSLSLSSSRHRLPANPIDLGNGLSRRSASQDAEKLGLTPEQMKALEEEAAAEGLKTLWKSAKLEVESVIRASSRPFLPSAFRPHFPFHATQQDLSSRLLLPFNLFVGETCDRILSDSMVSKEKLRLRAVGLELLGEVSSIS